MNPAVSQSNGNAWSLFYVPGAKFMDEQRVAHGAISVVHYYSGALGKDRRMHVYLPPGYERGRTSYPVFYLLHGAFDSDDSWSTVGRAGFIIDNLIASGAAKPMIVVMPDGHTSRFSPSGRGGPGGLNVDDFVREFNADIKPYVEAHYRALTDRRSTAIAGLSMGGVQTLDIAFGDLSKYAYVGVFSSGVFNVRDSSDWETHASRAARRRCGEARPLARVVLDRSRRLPARYDGRDRRSTEEARLRRAPTSNRPARTRGSTGAST